MTPKYGSILLVLLFALFCFVAISSVEADSRFGEECVDQSNQRKSCERGKAFICERSRCACAKGEYNKERDRCVVRLGEDCSLQTSDAFAECSSLNAKCETSRGSSDYGKCTCKPGEDCSAATAFGPTVVGLAVGLVVAVFNRM